MKDKVPFSRTSMNKSEQSQAVRIWQAIRELQVFTLDAIADQLNLTSQDVQGYVFWLCRNGYLDYGREIKLVKNTGSAAPVALKTGFYDPNIA